MKLGWLISAFIGRLNAWEQIVPEGISRSDVMEYGCNNGCCRDMCDLWHGGIEGVERCRTAAPRDCEIWMRRKYALNAEYLDCVFSLRGVIALNFGFADELKVTILDPVKVIGIEYECDDTANIAETRFRVQWVGQGSESTCSSGNATPDVAPVGSIEYDENTKTLTLQYQVLQSHIIDKQSLVITRGQRVGTTWACRSSLPNANAFRLEMEVFEYTFGTRGPSPATNPPAYTYTTSGTSNAIVIGLAMTILGSSLLMI